jgi:hypothetical protein
MADNFLRGDRDQPFLLPPDLRDWLPDGDVAWFILDVTKQLDLEHGQARGDELPEALASRAGRLARLRQAKALLEAEAAERQRRYAQRVAALAAAARASGKQPRAHIKPRVRDEAPNPKATANTTDPDSRFMHTRRGSVQGYNAQAVTTAEQVIVAAELTQQANDLQQLDPMLAAITATLDAAGIAERPRRLLADAGYPMIANLTQLPGAPELLIPPARHGRQGKPRKDGKPSASRSDGLRAAMQAKLASDDGKALYALRQQTIEPVFGQLKEQQGARWFLLPAPAGRGAMTVFDVAAAGAVVGSVAGHAEAVRAWAAGVWQAWAPQDGPVAALADRVLWLGA